MKGSVSGQRVRLTVPQGGSWRVPGGPTPLPPKARKRPPCAAKLLPKLENAHPVQPGTNPPSSQSSKTPTLCSQTSRHTSSTLQNAHTVQWRVAGRPTPLPPKTRKRAPCAAKRAARPPHLTKRPTCASSPRPIVRNSGLHHETAAPCAAKRAGTPKDHPKEPQGIPRNLEKRTPCAMASPRKTNPPSSQSSKTFTVCSQTSGQTSAPYKTPNLCIKLQPNRL